MSSIKRNFIYNAFYQVLVLIIPLITTPYISRILGADGIGIYSYSYSIAQYYALFILLGLNNYGNRTIARVRDNNDTLRTTFWSIYTMQFGLGLIVLIIYFFYAIFLAKNTNAALIMGLYVISSCFDINWFFFGMEKFKATTTRNTIVKIITTILIFCLVKEHQDVYKYCIIMVVGMLASQIVLWPYVTKTCGFYRPRWSEVKVHLKPNLILFLTVIAVSLFKIMDKIMLGLMTDTSQVGFYESSERVISIPTALVTALGTVMLPRMSNLRDKSNDSKSLIYKSIIFAMLLSTSMSFGIMAVSKTFVPMFYGPGYDLCISLYLILLPSCLFFAFGNVIRTQYLLPNEFDSIYVKSAFLGAGVNIIINILLIPNLGAVGAAIGTLVAEMTVCTYQALKIRKNIDIKKYVLRSIPFVISGTVMFSVIYNLNLPIGSNIIKLFAEIACGVLVYFFCILIQLGVAYKFFKINWLKPER